MPRTPDEMLKDLKDDVVADLERQRRTVDNQFDALPATLAQLSDMSGIDQMLLLRAVNYTHFNHFNIPVGEIISIMNDIHIHLKRLQKEDMEKDLAVGLEALDAERQLHSTFIRDTSSRPSRPSRPPRHKHPI